jgi:hypothetical protein
MGNKYFWTSLAIVAMWLAVLFPGVYGPTFEVRSVTDVVSIPTAWGIAPFAMIASIVVGIFGFRKPD